MYTQYMSLYGVRRNTNRPMFVFVLHNLGILLDSRYHKVQCVQEDGYVIILDSYGFSEEKKCK